MTVQCDARVDVAERRRELVSGLEDGFDRPERVPTDDAAAFEDIPVDEDGVWRCPRRATDAGACPLHADSSADADIRDEIERALAGDDDPLAIDDPDRDQRTRFLGVEIDSLDLRELHRSAQNTTEIDLRFSSIETIQFRESTLDRTIRVDGATIGSIEGSSATLRGSFHARLATIEDGLTIEDATVDGRLDFRFCRIGGDAAVRNTDCGSRIDFGFTLGDGLIDARECSCVGRFTLKESRFDHVRASDIDVAGPDPDSDIPGLQFRGLTTDGDIDVAGADCRGQLLGYEMAVGGDFCADETTFTRGVSLGSNSKTNLAGARIGGALSFEGATVEDKFKIVGPRDGAEDPAPAVGGRVDLSGSTIACLRANPVLTHHELSVVDCRGARIEGGELAQPATGEPLVYDLRDATLGSVDFSARSATIPECVWFDKTQFDGFTFKQERQAFGRENWVLVTDDPESCDAVAYSRVFEDATEYAKDFAAICLAQEQTREWLRETEPPYSIDDVAETVFEDVEDGVATQIATNGPESETQLGPEPYRRERYRVGVSTVLAGRYVGGSRSESATETDVDEILSSGTGATLQSLAERIDSSADTLSEVSRPTDAENGSSDPVSELRDEIAATLADERDVALSLEDEELTYIRARKGADDVGDSTTAGRLFVNEQRVRRRIHQRDGDTLKAVSNRVLDAVAEYGERPRRAFLSSLGIIGVFTLVYWGLWYLSPSFSSVTYEGISGAFLLSTASFTAFVLGGTTVDPKLVRFLANIEALLGAFMIALFVFTLTRSLHR